MSGEEVIETVDGRFSAYLSRPHGRSSASVIVLQEIFGLTPFIRGVCDRLAAEGYTAAAPDLFWRQEPGVVLQESERERAMHLMKVMDEDLALRDCVSTIAWLHASSPGKVAGLGFCLGGKLAYLLAAFGHVDAAISYYGVGIHDALELAANIRVPILLHLPLEDALCPTPARERIVAAMRAAPCVGTILEYPGVGHAFARTGGAPYDHASAVRANEATSSFLAWSLAASE